LAADLLALFFAAMIRFPLWKPQAQARTNAARVLAGAL
jgi:hypothetical protein